MNRTLKVTLFIVGIFACGVVVGAIGARRLASPPRPAGMGADGFGPHMMRRLTAELALTDAQRIAIEPLIKSANDELRVLRRESMRQSGAVMEAMEAAVSAELTLAQREKFAALKEAQKARMKAVMEERQRRRGESVDREGREPGSKPAGSDKERDGPPPRAD
jgi:Spy/CpxP family protein refolding chaperone